MCEASAGLVSLNRFKTLVWFQLLCAEKLTPPVHTIRLYVGANILTYIDPGVYYCSIILCNYSDWCLTESRISKLINTNRQKKPYKKIRIFTHSIH